MQSSLLEIRFIAAWAKFEDGGALQRQRLFAPGIQSSHSSEYRLKACIRGFLDQEFCEDPPKGVVFRGEAISKIGRRRAEPTMFVRSWLRSTHHLREAFRLGAPGLATFTGKPGFGTFRLIISSS